MFRNIMIVLLAAACIALGANQYRQAVLRDGEEISAGEYGGLLALRNLYSAKDYQEKVLPLVEDGVAAFPDAVTARGAKHLRTLMDIRASGARAAMLYIIQRPDGACFSAADYVDPVYAEALREAAAKGVEVYPVVVDIDTDGIRYGGVLEYRDFRP